MPDILEVSELRTVPHHLIKWIYKARHALLKSSQETILYTSKLPAKKKKQPLFFFTKLTQSTTMASSLLEVRASIAGLKDLDNPVAVFGD